MNLDEERGLIKEVVGNPADDMARLIYADWLDDHGDPRGGFLRAELSFAQNGTFKESVEGVAFFNNNPNWLVDSEWLAEVALSFDLEVTDIQHGQHPFKVWLSNQSDVLYSLEILHGLKEYEILTQPTYYYAHMSQDLRLVEKLAQKLSEEKELGIEGNQNGTDIPLPLFLPLKLDLISVLAKYRNMQQALFMGAGYSSRKNNAKIRFLRSSR